MNTDHRDVSDDAGFGLIEIVVSMLLLGVLALAILPLLVSGLKQSATNATVATATQLANQQLDGAKGQNTCSGISTGTTTTTDSRGVPLSVTKTLGTCPTSFPGTVTFTVTVVRTDTSKTLVSAPTLIYVTGA